MSMGRKGCLIKKKMRNVFIFKALHLDVQGHIPETVREEGNSTFCQSSCRQMDALGKLELETAGVLADAGTDHNLCTTHLNC